MRKTSKAVAWLFAVIMLFSCMSAVASAASKNPSATKKISSSVTATTVKLTWSKVSGANGYRVYQSVSGKWKAIKSSTKDNTYTVKNLKPATSYKFAVKTYKNVSGKTYWSNAKSVTVKTAAVSNTKILKAIPGENCKVELRWSKVSGAAGYAIYMYKDGAWQKIKALTGKTYTVTGLDQNTTYKFKVKTYIKVSGKYYYSSGKNISVKTGALSVGEVTDVKTSATEDSVTLNWSGSGNITGYRVYSYSEESGYKKLVTTKKNSYTVKGLANKTSYTYTVRPYAKSGSTTVWGKNFKVVANTTLPAPAAMTARINGNEAEIIWSAVSGADGYRVYVYDEVTEKYKTAVSSTESNIYNITLPENEMRKIAVRAYAKKADGSGNVWSAYKYFTVGGTMKYRDIFASGEYSFTTEIDGQKTTIYVKDGSCQMKTTMAVTDGVNAVCKIIYNKDKNKTIAIIEIDDSDPIYCSDVKKIIGEDIDMSQLIDFGKRFAGDVISSEITVSEYTGVSGTLVRESFINEKGETVSFYFDDGELVRHEVSSATAIERVDIENMKESVDDEEVSAEIPWWGIDIGIFM